jgi:hypothetical protein
VGGPPQLGLSSEAAVWRRCGAAPGTIAFAQLADRGDRVRTGGVADQLIQRHQITWPPECGIRPASALVTTTSIVPFQLYALRQRSGPG